jgi:hypothetical protein
MSMTDAISRSFCAAADSLLLECQALNDRVLSCQYERVHFYE